MSKLKVGNKQNSVLNGEWGHHVNKFEKTFTNKVRRDKDKQVINEELKF